MHLTANGRFSAKNDKMKLVRESIVMAPVLLLLPAAVQGKVFKEVYSLNKNQHASV